MTIGGARGSGFKSRQPDQIPVTDTNLADPRLGVRLESKMDIRISRTIRAFIASVGPTDLESDSMAGL
jgi:hypothetical protein